MSRPAEWVVLCEGYDDRAFLAGWLNHLGLDDRRPRDDDDPPSDPWGAPVKGGTYAFRSRGGTFVRLQPCRGVDQVFRRLRLRLSAHETGTRALHGLVVVVDEDAPVGVSDAGDSLPARFEGAVRRAAGAARRQEDDSYALESGGAPVALLVWRCDDPPSDLLPPKQTLERLVCAAIGAAYPRRPDAVRSWLTARPAPPDDEPAHKAHAWSHMAGWYADHGCDDFYRAVWRDGRIAAELERRIALATGRRLLERLGNTGG